MRVQVSPSAILLNQILINLKLKLMLPFTLQQLRILKSIITEKSFTKASKVLFLSQPYISKQIKTLEQSLGVNLLYRNSNIVFLTENGHIFLKYSERILTLCEESYRALIDLGTGNRGKLIIGASQTIGTYLVPRLLALFARNYPKINVKVQVNSTRLISKLIINRQIDLAIVGGKIPQELKQNLMINHFIEDDLNLIISNLNPFAKKKHIKKEELYYLNFITLYSNSTIRKFIDNILKQNKIETNQFNIILQLNSVEAMKTAVSLGLGVAFVSSSAIEKEIRLKNIKILKIKNIKMARTLLIVSNFDYHKTEAFNSFYNELMTLKHKVNSFVRVL